jgi:4-hydroxy-tetrahydrodipicolinate synthase
MSDLAAAALNNDWNKARRIQRQFHPLMQANFLESNPMPVKAVLAMMGRIEEVLRLPMLPVKQETRAKLEKLATELGLLQVHATVSDL